MNQLLIVDDAEHKIDFIKICLKSFAPESLKDIPTVLAYTRDEAMRIIEASEDLRAGLIDCHLDHRENLDGPEIIGAWRKIETEKGRKPAFLALQTRSSVKTTDFDRCSKAALAAGANDAVSLVYNDGVNPVEALRKVFEKMVPYFTE